MDPFDFVEGLIRGLVYFAYNVLGTFWLLLKHPLRGPRYLHRKHEQSGARQIGSLTFLFLSFLLLYWTSLGGINASEGLQNADQLTDAFAAFLNGLPDLTAKSLWPVIIASLTSAVVIDGLLRIVLVWAVPSNRRRAQVQLAAAEYSLALCVLAAALSLLLLAAFIRSIVFAGTGSYLWLGFTVTSLFAAAYPPAVAIDESRPGASGGKLRTALLMTFVVGLFSVSVYAGAMLGSDSHDRREINERASAGPRVQTLACTLRPDKRVEVDGLLSFQGSGSSALKVTRFNLRLETDRGERHPASPLAGISLTYAGVSPERYFMITEQKPELVRFLSDDSLAALPTNAYCRFSSYDAPNSGRPAAIARAVEGAR